MNSKQVGFRCSESFYNRIRAHQKSSRTPIQKMMVQALERFFEAKETPAARNAVRNVSKFWATAEEERLVRAMFDAARYLPRERLNLLQRELELDADAYRKAATRGPSTIKQSAA